MSGFTLGVLFSDLAVAPICVVPSCGSEVLCPRVALLCVVSFAGDQMSFPYRLLVLLSFAGDQMSFPWRFVVVSWCSLSFPCRLLVLLVGCWFSLTFAYVVGSVFVSFRVFPFVSSVAMMKFGF